MLRESMQNAAPKQVSTPTLAVANPAPAVTANSGNAATPFNPATFKVYSEAWLNELEN